jgi:glutamate dehydrogenase/leucine dehydrogenase
MAWMLEAYEKKTGGHAPATFTGKPVSLGGSLGRTEATGLGGFFVLQSYMKEKKMKPAVTSVAVQGFGNVGYWFSKFAHDKGYKIVAVSDSSGGVFRKRGLDPDKIMEYKKGLGSIKASVKTDKLGTSAEFISNEKLLKLDVDVLVPAALENAIDAENANEVKAKVILELANGPTTPEADNLLEERVDVIPDVLANAGGVTVSYFEWVQNLHGYSWTKERVNEELSKIMDDAFEKVAEVKVNKKVSFRKAAYLLAIKRIVEAMIARGRV